MDTDGRHRQFVIALATLVVLINVWLVAELSFNALGLGIYLLIWEIALGALPGVMGMWLAALGYGYGLQRICRLKLNLFEQVAAGMAVWLWLLYVLAWLVGFSWVGVGLVGTIGAGLLAWQCSLMIRKHRNAQQPLSRNDNRLIALVAVVLTCLTASLAVVACSLPPNTIWPTEARGFDVLNYQLQIPREWLAAGGMVALAHNTFNYLPGLVNAGYAWLGFGYGGFRGSGLYSCSWFHMSMAWATAGVLGSIVWQHVPGQGRATGWLTAAVFLSVPWVLITGSLAYNEMAVCLFGAAALSVILNRELSRGKAILIGLLLAAAVMSKLSSVLMVAMPLAGSWALWLILRRTSWRLSLQAFALTVVAGSIVMAPYLIRNTVWTGNPLFPFATDVMGMGHWTMSELTRWREAHSAVFSHHSKIGALWYEWLSNTGYSALSGWPTEHDNKNVARFDRESGLPTLWLAAAVGWALVCGVWWRNRKTEVADKYIEEIQPNTRDHVFQINLVLVLVLFLQMLAWLFFTHMQSRFLLPTLLPTVLMLGVSSAWLAHVWLRWRWYVVATQTLVILAGMIASLSVLHATSQPLRTMIGNDDLLSLRATWFAREVAPPTPGPWLNHWRDHVDTSEPVMLVPGTGALLYIEGPFIYAGAFNRHPLQDALAAVNNDAMQLPKQLYDQGIRKVRFDLSEMQRLHRSYTPGVSLEAMTVLQTWLAGQTSKQAQQNVTSMLSASPVVMFELVEISPGVIRANLLDSPR